MTKISGKRGETRDMEKQKIVFLHGAQGVGKTTITNLLREKLTHTTLIRLAGVPSYQEEADKKAMLYHLSLMDGMNRTFGTGMNYIVDRSFLCEKVYSNLGYKPHTFEDEVIIIENVLETMTEYFDIYFVLLKANEETLQQRLRQREKAQFEAVQFKVENSLAQQKEYEKEFLSLPKSVHLLGIEVDGMSSDFISDFIVNQIFRKEETQHDD